MKERILIRGGASDEPSPFYGQLRFGWNFLLLSLLSFAVMLLAGCGGG
jgi:hypothetical protein